MKSTTTKKIFTSIFVFLLCFTYAQGQLSGTVIYDFRDGTIIAAKKSTDGSLKLNGTFSLKDATYGLDMKANSKIKIYVAGSSAIRFLGSSYSSLYMEGTTYGGTKLEPVSKATKVTNNLTDVYDFVYSGAADTLIFTAVQNAGAGSDVYLPKIDVIPAQAGGGAALTTPAKNIVYYFDLRDGSIISKTPDGTTTINTGLFKLEKTGTSNYGYNGTQHGSILKAGTKITLQVAGNSYIRVGGCQYSAGIMSITSATGAFNVNSQNAKTAQCFDVNRTSLDFLYVGTAGAVTLDFTATTYIPYIEIVPVPYTVELDPWVVKTGTITVNNTVITYTAGATSTDNAALSVSAGTVISATADKASIRINLAGKALSTYTPAFTGDIASATVDADSLKITFTGASSKPKSYKITISDNSSIVEAEAGKTYTYNFYDGSVLPQTAYSSLRYATFVTKDNLVTLNSNTATLSKQFGYHDAAHGAVLFPGNSVDILVAGNATISFITCQYGSATDAKFEFTDANGIVLGSCDARANDGVDASPKSFTYSGAKGKITATLKSTNFPIAEVYIHGLNVENAAKLDPINGKVYVWDFGAEQLDPALYNNKLDSAAINSWYAGTITAGSNTNVLPGFTSGTLSWVGGTNDRLRTSNTKLTRFDENLGGVAGYTGRVYVNAISAARYMSLTLSADDEVTIVEKTDAGGNINFQYVANPTAQTDAVAVTSNLDTLTFVAKEAGTYHIFDNVGKPSYYRIFRKDATYVTIYGTVDVSQAAGIPAGYGITMKNAAGKIWTAVVSGSAFSIKVPAGYNYGLGLANANGYIISNGNSLSVTQSTTSYQVAVKKVELYTVTGSITGLGSNIASLSLVYTPDASANKIFKPVPVIDANAGTYSVQLEPNCQYTISVKGVNDYTIPTNTITIGTANTTADLTFIAKSVYNITINATGLAADQLAKLSLTFTNMNETGYSYSFSSVTGITLRDGTYSIAYSGLDDYPVQMGLTSNMQVNGAATNKTLAFVPVNSWSFDDKAIANGTTSYKGLLFTGTVASELAKGHLTAKSGATIKVPVNVGEKVKITYYYSADFSIEGGTAITTASSSITTFEYAEYTYPGTVPGYVTITVGSGATTTYFPEISTVKTLEYKPIIYVGTDKDYKTINEALTAITKMVRGATDRVTVMIDPGNYEEMLVVNSANVTLKNASATPSIALKNKGVDIDANAVRVTSYYGHGYNYYSMGTDQKWNADVLRVNKENGTLSYENKGSGTTNGSYWNATVVIGANGFQADNIIFENSYNQYISKKESEDVVVMWAVGNKGLRPTAVGNTNVQKRSFVERAAAIAILNNMDKIILSKCRVVGRQDAFYGGTGTRVAVIKGSVMGAVDYIFGGMTAVFYKTDLAMNVCDDAGDAAYIAAGQQSSGRGYLMYKCTVKSAIPGIESASTLSAKPGYFGRPWQATTSEVVYYNTFIDISNFTGSEGKSLISPLGWDNSLGGTSALMYEYGTFEKSGENNLASRASWATKLTTPTLTDGTEITTLNFTKGTDGWDPIPVETDALALSTGTLSIAAPANSTKTFDITSNVSWMVASNQTWLTASVGAGFDNLTVTLTAAANTSFDTRTATVTVSGNGVTTQTITVTQEGIAKVLTVSSSALAIAAPASSTKTFDITSNIDWTVVSNQTWLTISSASGNSNATITLTATVNPTTAARSATVTVSGSGVTSQVITVTQDAGATGINEIAANALHVYPNPATDVVYIQRESSLSENLIIMDLSGIKLIEKQIHSTIESIDISNLPKGIYIVKVGNKKTKLLVE